MSSYTYDKSRYLVKTGQVKLLSNKKGHLHFRVKTYDVWRNDKKLWNCGAITEKSDGRLTGCAYNQYRNKEYCSHVISCIHWLGGMDLK